MSSTQVAYFERVHDESGYRFDGPFLADMLEQRGDHVVDVLVDTGSGPRLVADVHHLLAPLVSDQHPTFYLHHWRGVRPGDGLGHHSADVQPDWADLEHTV